MRWLVAHGVLLAAAVAVCAVPAANAQPAPFKRVMIVHGGPEHFPSNPEFDALIRRELQSAAVKTEAYSEYLENEEFGDLAATTLREYIRLKYRGAPFALVIANTAPALQFVLRHRSELFSNAPIVFATATLPPEIVQGKVPDVTGIVREPSLIETAELMLRLHPGTKRLHVVAYAPVIDGFDARVRSSLAPFSKRVKLTFSDEPTLEEMLATIRALPADSLVLGNRYTPMPTGRAVFPDQLIPGIYDASPVPLYATLDSYMGSGVVGGMMRSYSSSAIRLGQMSAQILGGASPASIPIEPASLKAIFDWRQLQRWNIHESLLPEGAEIRFQVQDAWQLYGWYIIATSIVVAAQLFSRDY
jgi:hypothetical protein